MNEEVSDILKTARKGKTLKSRKEALEKLVDLKHKDVFEIVGYLLEDEKETVRKIVFPAIQKTKDKQFIPVLLELLLNDNSSPIRNSALATLTALNWKPKTSNERITTFAIQKQWDKVAFEGEKTKEPLLHLVSTLQNKTITNKALSILSIMKCKEAIPYILRNMDAYNPSLTKILRDFGKEAIPDLEKGLKENKNSIIRTQIISVLKELDWKTEKDELAFYRIFYSNELDNLDEINEKFYPYFRNTLDEIEQIIEEEKEVIDWMDDYYQIRLKALFGISKIPKHKQEVLNSLLDIYYHNHTYSYYSRKYNKKYLGDLLLQTFNWDVKTEFKDNLEEIPETKQKEAKLMMEKKNIPKLLTELTDLVWYLEWRLRKENPRYNDGKEYSHIMGGYYNDFTNKERRNSLKQELLSRISPIETILMEKLSELHYWNFEKSPRNLNFLGNNPDIFDSAKLDILELLEKIGIEGEIAPLLDMLKSHSGYFNNLFLATARALSSAKSLTNADLTDQLEKKKGIDEKAIIIILTKRRELQIYDILLDNLSNQSDEQIHEYTLRALIELYSIDKLEKILEDYKKKTITILTEFAQSQHREERMLTLLFELLSKINDKTVIPMMVKIIRQNERYFRYKGIEYLSYFKDKRALDFILESVTVYDYAKHAKEAIVNMGKFATNILIKKLTSAGQELQIAILDILGSLKDKQAIKTLFELLNETEDKKVREFIVIALLDIDEVNSTKYFLEKLKRKEIEPNEYLLSVAGELNLPETGDILWDIVENSTTRSRLRDAALQTLMTIDSSNSVTIAAKQYNLSWDMKQQLRESLLNFDDVEKLHELHEMLDTSEEEFKILAVKVLAKIGTKDSIQILLKHLDDSPRMTQEVSLALSELGWKASDIEELAINLSSTKRWQEFFGIEDIPAFYLFYALYEDLVDYDTEEEEDWEYREINKLINYSQPARRAHNILVKKGEEVLKVFLNFEQRQFLSSKFQVATYPRMRNVIIEMGAEAAVFLILNFHEIDTCYKIQTLEIIEEISRTVPTDLLIDALDKWSFYEIRYNGRKYEFDFNGKEVYIDGTKYASEFEQSATMSAFEINFRIKIDGNYEPLADIVYENLEYRYKLLSYLKKRDVKCANDKVKLLIALFKEEIEAVYQIAKENPKLLMRRIGDWVEDISDTAVAVIMKYSNIFKNHLIESLKDPHVPLEKLIWLLGKTDTKEAIPNLLQLFEHANKKLKRTIAWNLAILGESKVIKLITDIFPQLNQDELKSFIEVLKKFEWLPETDRDVMYVLISEYKLDEIVQYGDDALYALVNLMNSTENHNRIKTYMQVLLKFEPKIYDVLLEFLEKDECNFKYCALEALTEKKDKRVLPYLEVAYKEAGNVNAQDTQLGRILQVSEEKALQIHEEDLQTDEMLLERMQSGRKYSKIVATKILLRKSNEKALELIRNDFQKYLIFFQDIFDKEKEIDETFISQLLNSTQTGNYDNRKKASEILIEFGKEILPIIHEKVTNNQLKLNSHLIHIFGEFNDDTLINQILEYTKNAQEGDMRTSYSALEKIENDKIVDFLIKEASEKLNQYAIRALGKHIDSKALPILINISQKKLIERTQKEIINSLSSYESEEAAKEIVRSMMEEKYSHFIKEEHLEPLLSLPDYSEKLLLKVFNNQDEDIEKRIRAAEFLSKLKSEEICDTLMKMLRSNVLKITKKDIKNRMAHSGVDRDEANESLRKTGLVRKIISSLKNCSSIDHEYLLKYNERYHYFFRFPVISVLIAHLNEDIITKLLKLPNQEFKNIIDPIARALAAHENQSLVLKKLEEIQDVPEDLLKEILKHTRKDNNYSIEISKILLKNPSFHGKSHAVYKLKEKFWYPQTIEEQINYSIGLRDWNKLVELGVESVRILLEILPIPYSNKDDFKNVFVLVGNEGIEYLEEVYGKIEGHTNRIILDSLTEIATHESLTALRNIKTKLDQNDDYQDEIDIRIKKVKDQLKEVGKMAKELSPEDKDEYTSKLGLKPDKRGKKEKKDKSQTLENYFKTEESKEE